MLTMSSWSSAGLPGLSSALAVSKGSMAAGRRRTIAFSSSALHLVTYSRSTPVWNAMRARCRPAL